MEWSAPVLTEIHPDPNDKTIIAYSVQDCQAILDENKELRDQQQKSDGMRLVAQIPNNILYGWMVEEWERGNKDLHMGTAEWRELVRKKLRDPNWKYLLI